MIEKKLTLAKHVPLDHHRLQALRNCLSVAAERFKENADELRPYVKQWDEADEAARKEILAQAKMMHPGAVGQIMRTMDEQHAEALALIDWLDGDAFQDKNGDYPEDHEFVVTGGLVKLNW